VTGRVGDLRRDTLGPQVVAEGSHQLWGRFRRMVVGWVGLVDIFLIAW
jgi:hypothetical protein